MVTRHELLVKVHGMLKPDTYLETGVQYGTSLNLAVHSRTVIGIDPHPLVKPRGNQQIFTMTSNDFFTYHMEPEATIDLAFIDGSHLIEDVLQDFINIELHSHPATVVIFDDILPLTHDMASRSMVPGHWTGDVWKIVGILGKYRPDLVTVLVDTEPTGTMIVFNLSRENKTLPFQYYDIIDTAVDCVSPLVPDYLIERRTALQTDTALLKMMNWVNGTEATR